MNLKQFLWPDKKKVALTAVLLAVFFLMTIIPTPLTDLFNQFVNEVEFFYYIPLVVYYYLISCFIVWLYGKIRRKGKPLSQDLLLSLRENG